MKKLTLLALLFYVLIFNIGCKKIVTMVTPEIKTPSANAIDNSLDILDLLPTVNVVEVSLVPTDSKVMAEINAMPLPELAWFYNRVGRSTWFYESKIDDSTFTENELKQLIKVAYSKLPIQRENDKQAATFALQYSVYKGLSKNENTKTYKAIKAIALSPVFLQEIVKQSPSLISLLPHTVQNYDDICALSVLNNPTSFDYLIVENRIKSKIVNSLFNAQPTVELSVSMLRKKALDYASDEAAMYLMQTDGTALQFAPDRLKQNKFVVLSAIKNNPNAVTFADTVMQGIINEKGLIGILDYQVPTPSIEVKIQELKDKSVKTIYEFDAERCVPLDNALIQAMQHDAKRNLTELWLVANAGELGQLYIATFQPEGRNFLGSIILRKPTGEFLRYDMFAKQNPKTPLSVWFKNDGAVFSPDNFKILMMSKMDDKITIEMTWTQGDETRPVRLQEKGKAFKANNSFL